MSSTTVANDSRHPTDSVLRSPAPAVSVHHRGGDRFDIEMRRHTITVDQPQDAGGTDIGPTPTELFVASLASCVAFYARRYFARHEVDPGDLSVQATYQMMAKPPRVGEIEISVQIPADLPAAKREALLAVVNHCTVHNSLTTPPEVSISLAD
jgi:putative redox protein